MKTASGWAPAWAFSPPRSPGSISKFLVGLKPAEGASEEQTAALDRLKKLIANVVQGEKPSIIEAAQIRQAAQRANVSLALVDSFLEYVEGQPPSMLEVPTKSSEEWTGDSKFLQFSFFCNLSTVLLIAWLREDMFSK